MDWPGVMMRLVELTEVWLPHWLAAMILAEMHLEEMIEEETAPEDPTAEWLPHWPEGMILEEMRLEEMIEEDPTEVSRMDYPEEMIEEDPAEENINAKEEEPTEDIAADMAEDIVADIAANIKYFAFRMN
jgi:hypothetical protein